MSETDSVALLDRLVGFPTVSRDSNLALIEFVRAFLAERGIEPMVMADETGAKANLFATIGAAGPGGILLSGHTDVVPVDGQDWRSDPFRLEAEGDRLLGRGAADMKGFLACALRAADRAARRRLKTPLHLAFSYDEELGCLGVRPMLDRLAALGLRPSLCIVGEPTSMLVAIGHKGKTGLRATCCGVAAHSALAPSGLNAIHLAVDFIGCLRARQADIAERGAADTAFDVPYTTLHVGKIAGGVVVNIVPERCVVDFEIRNLAADDPERLRAAILADADSIAAAARDRFPGADIVLETVNGYPGLNIAAEDDAVGVARGLAGDGGSLTKVAYGTEGGLIHRALGVPTVVCGPGSMEQGHKADEFVTLSQMLACDAMMDRIVDRLAA